MFVGDGSNPLDKQFLVGRFFGIPLYIHIFLIIFFGITVLTSLAPFNLQSMLLPVILMFSVYLHELGHALTARRFGVRPHRIVLHIFGGVAEIPPGLQRRQELWVIAMGPAVSGILMIIGILGGLLFALVPVLGPTLWTFGLLNGVLFFFNILPIFPLDGGQFLRNWISLRGGQTAAIQRSLPLSMLVLIGLSVVGLVFYRQSFGMLSFVLALILLYYNYIEWQRWKHLFKRGFWSYLVPGSGGFGTVGDRFYVWMHRSKAEKLIRKAEDEGVHALSRDERTLLDKYLDAKIRLRAN
jgi:Zn-dependent protease